MKISTLIKQSDINRFASIGLSAQKVILGSGPGNLSASMGRSITGEARIDPVCPGWSLVSTRIGLVVVRDRKGVIIISYILIICSRRDDVDGIAGSFQLAPNLHF